MKPAISTLIGAALLGLTACIPSVHPFYTSGDVLFEPALIGEWTATDSEDQPEHWAFARDEKDEDDSAYILTVTDKDGKQGKFRATLFMLRKHRFLDLIPVECDYAADQADLVGISMFAGHLLVHVEAIEPELKMAFSNFEWMEDHLKEKPGALAHYTEEGRILLTASTQQLQRFVLKHVDKGDLFSDYGSLKKGTATSEQKKPNP